MLPFCVKLATIVFNQLVKSSMTETLDTLTTEEAVLKKLMSFSLLTQKIKISLNSEMKLNEYEAYFQGDLVDHSRSCKDEDCICSLESFEFQDMKSKMEEWDKYKEKRASEILSTGIERIKDNSKLKLTFVNMKLQNENVRLSSALLYIQSISINKFNTFKWGVNTQKFLLLQKIEEKLDNFFNSKDKGVLNVKDYVDFQITQTNFKNLIISNTKRFLDFWSYYQEPNFILMSLFNKSRMIEIEAKEIENEWNLNTKKFSLFHNSMGEIYCMYQGLVRNMPYLAHKISKQFSWKIGGLNSEGKKPSSITEANLILPDTMTFYVSMTKEKLGKIQYVSSNVETVLGYSARELLGKNINILMSHSLAKDHDKAINQHIQQAKSLEGRNFLNISGYVKNQQGYFLPITSYMTVFPYVQKELTYLGIVRVKESPYEQIILTANGFVDGFTEKIGKILELPFENALHILDICPEISLKPNKTVKIASLVLSQQDEINPSSKKFQSKTSSILNNIKVTRKDLESDYFGEEGTWKVHFLKTQGSSKYDENRQRKEKIQVLYEVKIINKTYFGKLFHILLLRPTAAHQGNSRMSIVSKKDVAKDNSFVYETEVPSEILEPVKTPRSYSPLRLDFQSPKHEVEQTESEAALLSTKRTFLLNETPRLPDSIFSPKEQAKNIINEIIKTRGEKNFISHQSLFDNKKQMKEKEQEKDSRTTEKDESSQNNSLFVEDDKVQGKLSDKPSSIASNAISRKIEQAVYSVPPNRIRKGSFAIVASFFILCIGLIAGFVAYGDKVLNQVQGNILILNLSSSRRNEIMFVHRFSELITFLRQNLILNDRFEPVYGTKMQSSLPGNLYTEANYLRNLNGRFRNLLNQSDTDLMRNLNKKKIPMLLEDGTYLYANNFDAITEILMRAFTARHNSKIFTQEDPNVEFILKNSLNELLVDTESLNNHFIQDNETKLENLSLIPLVFLLVVLVLGGFLVSLLVYQQQIFIKNRNAFIDIFLRLSEVEIISTTTRVQAFLVMLTQNNHNMDKLKTQNSITKASQQAKTQHKRIPKKETNLQNINRRQYSIFVFGLLLFLVFVMPFLHIFFLVQNNNSDVRNKITILTKATVDLYNILLLTGSFFQYLRTDGNSLLRNNPINEEWENLLQTIAKSQDSLVHLLIYFQNEKTCSESTIATLNHLILGNLCQAKPLSSFARLCPKLPAERLLSNGIQGLNSFSIATLSTLKKKYDISARTFNDAKEIINQQDMIYLDLMVATFQSYGYMSLQSTLQKCTLESIDMINGNLKVILKMYIPIFVILIPILLYLLLKKLEEERVEWRKIFRKIPIEILMTNKILKHHLVRGLGKEFTIQI